MRIGFVVTGGFDRSGTERVIPSLLALVERLARTHDVVVYVLRYHDRPCSYRLCGALVRDLGRPEGTVAQHRTLKAAIVGDGPFDVLHAYWALPAGLAAATVGARLRIPVVVTFDSGELTAIDDIDYGLQRSLVQRVAVSTTAALASRVTVCTDYMHRLATALGIPALRIPIGIDRDRFAGAGAPDGPPWRLIHVASLNAVKDQTTLLHALRFLAARRPDVFLDIVGEDTLGGRLQTLARQLGVAHLITFHGFRPAAALARLYRRAHLHVLSSRHEAAGVVTLEAAAAGIPTVGSAVGYVADWMPDRAVGVPPGRPEALADAIDTLLADGERRRTMAAAARDWTIAHDADWSAIRFESVFRDLAAAPPTGGF